MRTRVRYSGTYSYGFELVKGATIQVLSDIGLRFNNMKNIVFHHILNISHTQDVTDSQISLDSNYKFNMYNMKRILRVVITRTYSSTPFTTYGRCQQLSWALSEGMTKRVEISRRPILWPLSQKLRALESWAKVVTYRVTFA